MKFIDVYTLIFNSKLGLLSLIKIKSAYNVPTVQDIYEKIFKIINIFKFNVGIEFFDSFVKLITGISDKLKAYESYKA